MMETVESERLDKLIPTKSFIIHYAKDGVHIVPTRP
jgi:hypothetical protein